MVACLKGLLGWVDVLKQEVTCTKSCSFYWQDFTGLIGLSPVNATWNNCTGNFSPPLSLSLSVERGVERVHGQEPAWRELPLHPRHGLGGLQQQTDARLKPGIWGDVANILWKEELKLIYLRSTSG